MEAQGPTYVYVGGAAKGRRPAELREGRPREGRPAGPQNGAPPAPGHVWIGDPQEACARPTDEERNQTMEMMFRRLTEGKKPAKKNQSPHMILSIGPPGSGKSTVTRSLAISLSSEPVGNYVEFDFDTLGEQDGSLDKARNLTDLEGRPTGIGYAFAWLACDTSVAYGDSLLQRLMEGRYNLMLQSHDQRVLMDAHWLGYTCTLLYVAVSEETAVRRAGKRAEEVGRFQRPATAENAWGWKSQIARTWGLYRRQAPWYALWADTFVVVNNDVDGQFPTVADFVVLDPHRPSGTGGWGEAVGEMQAAIEDAHQKTAHQKTAQP